jgi:hypothetical protein
MTSASSVFSFWETSGWEIVGRKPRIKYRNNGTSVLFLRKDSGRASDRASANQRFSKRHPADRSAFDRKSLSLFGQLLKRRTGNRRRHTRLRGDQLFRLSCPLPHRIGTLDLCSPKRYLPITSSSVNIPFDTDTPTPLVGRGYGDVPERLLPAPPAVQSLTTAPQ